MVLMGISLDHEVTELKEVARDLKSEIVKSEKATIGSSRRQKLSMSCRLPRLRDRGEALIIRRLRNPSSTESVHRHLLVERRCKCWLAFRPRCDVP